MTAVAARKSLHRPAAAITFVRTRPESASKRQELVQGAAGSSLRATPTGSAKAHERFQRSPLLGFIKHGEVALALDAIISSDNALRNMR